MSFKLNFGSNEQRSKISFTSQFSNPVWKTYYISYLVVKKWLSSVSKVTETFSNLFDLLLYRKLHRINVRGFENFWIKSRSIFNEVLSITPQFDKWNINCTPDGCHGWIKWGKGGLPQRWKKIFFFLRVEHQKWIFSAIFFKFWKGFSLKYSINTNEICIFFNV